MSETLDEIEYRLSPDRMKHEAKEFLHETADTVREKYHPKRLAQQAGTNMKNTVREHPVPSLIAGLSLGYLLMKSAEERSHHTPSNGTHRPYRSSVRRAGEAPYGGHGSRRTRSRPSPSGYAQAEDRGQYEEPGMREQMRSASEKAAEKTEDVTEEAAEQAREMKEQAGEWAEQTGRQAQRTARSAKHSVKRRTRQVQGSMQDFINQNPLMAGALALGTGAMLGGLFPSTRTEDEWMGEARDEVMERAERATEDTMRRASDAAENVAEEAKSAAKDVAETTKEEAKRVVDEDDDSNTKSKDQRHRESKGASKPSGSRS
jgi:ElaB/YqjD/DUF883 family membrane-anchored ribosome-binding protein